jgi:hypothetical protein
MSHVRAARGSGFTRRHSSPPTLLLLTYANPLASLKTDNCQLTTKMSARRHFALGLKTVAAHNITT